MATKKKSAAKPAKKAAPAKKPAPAKKAAAKKPAPAPVKKPAPAPVKKPVPAADGKPISERRPARVRPVTKSLVVSIAPPTPNKKKTKTILKPAPKKKSTAPKKAITITKKPVKIVMPETPEFQNNEKDLAFSFAEQMKVRERQLGEQARKSAEAREIRLSRRPTTRKPGKNTMKFPASDLAEFRKRLLALRQEAQGASRTLRANALEQTDERGGEEEDGSDAFMRLQNLGQVGERNKVIRHIDDALRRIQDGTYGICDICGQLIRKQRLINLPFAHTCMECQNDMEARR